MKERDLGLSLSNHRDAPHSPDFQKSISFPVLGASINALSQSVSQSVSQSQHSQSLPDQKEIIEGSSTYIIPLLNGPQILSPSRSSTTKHRESPARRKQTPTPNSFTSCTNFFGGNLRIIMWRKLAKEFQRESHPPLEKFRALQLSLAHRFHKHRATVRGHSFSSFETPLLYEPRFGCHQLEASNRRGWTSSPWKRRVDLFFLASRKVQSPGT
jgi:hypothetical protein